MARKRKWKDRTSLWEYMLHVFWNGDGDRPPDPCRRLVVPQAVLHADDAIRLASATKQYVGMSYRAACSRSVFA
jgi:hypothetical protein